MKVAKAIMKGKLRKVKEELKPYMREKKVESAS